MAPAPTKLGDIILPVLMIGAGLGNLFILLIVTSTWTTILKVAIPIVMKFVPRNWPVQAFIVEPLPMSATAEVLDINSFREEGYIAVGVTDFKIRMDMDQSEDMIPAVYVEEENSFGSIQRVVMIPGPLNYGSILSWMVALGCLPTMLLGAWLRFAPASTKDTSVVEKVEDSYEDEEEDD